MSQKCGFLRWEPALDEGAVKTVDLTINDLGCSSKTVDVFSLLFDEGPSK